MKDLTIVIPTVNRIKELERLLNNISRFKIETNVLIVDDNNSSFNVIDKIDLNNYHFLNIKIIKSNENKGPAYCRFLSLNHIKTNFFMFCDDDDLIDIKVINKIKKKWKRNNIFVLNRIRETNNNYYYVNSFNKEKYFESSSSYIWGIIFNTNFYKRNTPPLTEQDDVMGEDIVSFYLLSNYNFSISKKTDGIAYYYLYNSNSLVNKYGETSNQSAKMYINNLITTCNKINSHFIIDKIISRFILELKLNKNDNEKILMKFIKDKELTMSQYFYKLKEDEEVELNKHFYSFWDQFKKSKTRSKIKGRRKNKSIIMFINSHL